jgi:hypothetical protein
VTLRVIVPPTALIFWPIVAELLLSEANVRLRELASPTKRTRRSLLCDAIPSSSYRANP